MVCRQDLQRQLVPDTQAAYAAQPQCQPPTLMPSWAPCPPPPYWATPPLLSFSAVSTSSEPLTASADLMRIRQLPADCYLSNLSMELIPCCRLICWSDPAGGH